MGAALLLVALLLPAGCALVGLFHPPGVGGVQSVPLAPGVSAGPSREVEVFIDEHGVPHIYGETDADLSYALGFMHARDRLFQILVLKHAASGRLGEIFGKGLVEEDRRLRLLTHRLADEEAALSEEARHLVQAYVDGLNEGAAHAGRSLEMQLLGLNAPPFEVRDVLAIARLQAWELSLDLRAELARTRIAARLPAGDPRRRALLVDVPANGVPVVGRRQTAFEEGAEPAAPVLEDRRLPSKTPPTPRGSTRGGSGGMPRPPASLEELFADQPTPGGSNAWAVHGAHTTTGAPILVHDPHLAHRAPGVFYLVHLEGSGLSVTGATLPGIPAVVTGATPYVSWAMTTSFADTQDLVRLKVSPQHPGRYVVDGRELPFNRHVERFLAGGDVLASETWASTMFGPVLPPGYAPEAEPGERYAVLWTGFDPEVTKDQLLAFWRLARAESLEDATAALSLVAASQGALLATSDGHIAFVLTGKAPVRRSSEPTSLPRDGSSSAAGWSGYLAPADHPSSTDPAAGFLVAANQRLVGPDHPAAKSLGSYASTPHRALRIHERLTELLERGPVDPEALLAIQQDVVSVEARALAEPLGEACPARIPGHPKARAQAFCAAVRDFDSSYSIESRGALPFTALLSALQEEVLAAHVGADVARQLLHQPFVVMAIENALLEELSGEPAALLDDLGTPQREGIKGFVKHAAERALTRVVEQAGEDPADWTWGRVHTLAATSPAASAPLVGDVLAQQPRSQAGWGRAPRAEAGLPVRSGAALRLLAEMGERPRIRLVSDFGNSGHVGHPNYGDLIERWDRGELLLLPRERRAVEAAARGRLLLLPRAAASAP